ncbi:MAG: histidine kinase [Verrucomicrobia bacterium]|nr:histidine kinase [Verrucomicrobiota bacterium]
MSTGQNPLARRRWRWIAIYVALWVVLGGLATVELYIAQLLWDKPVAWAIAFSRAGKEMLAYALCTLAVLWVCGRLRLEPRRRARWFFAHMGCALGFALAHVSLVSALEAGEISVQTGQTLTFSYLFEKLIISYTLSNIFKYWIVVLGCLGWHYYKAFRERERQAAAMATELVQARLQALRMQINPHFLFNTLNTISALIHENPDAADRMIVRLSELLRRTLDRGDVQEVPLREEIEFLKSYLEIEQMRFPDRLTVTFDIEPKTNELLVPHLILQPLVENALRHGIMPREEPGRVAISAAVTGGNTLELKVWNNGNGLSDPSDPSALSDKSPREGIGLKNVRSRLAQLYGGAQEFTLGNASGGGVEARIRIPCCTIPRSQAPQVVVMSATEASQAGLPLPTAASAKPKCC